MRWMNIMYYLREEKDIGALDFETYIGNMDGQV
jgi:hypothetical protein